MFILEHGDTLGFWGQALRKDFTKVPVAMVCNKKRKTRNMLRAATAAMADWVVCGGCSRGRE